MPYKLRFLRMQYFFVPRKRDNRFSGDHSEEETPVPFPNTAVKLFSGDGTMVLAMGE
jgi:hypothetical protein